MSDQTDRPRVITPREGFIEEVQAASSRLVGAVPDQILAPGGSFRDSVRLVLGDRSVILTKREQQGRGRLEVECLRRLSAEGAPVPRLLGYDGTWMAQEHIAGPRLSMALAASDGADRRALAEDAVDSLFEIADAGARAGLASIVPALGENRDWVGRVVARPARLARSIGVPLPSWDAEPCIERLSVPCTSFVKWDARPANAIVNADDRIVWIDWEHAGSRLGVEDFAWLSADEYFSAEVEDVAHSVALGLEERQAPSADRMDYLAVFATMHATVRLELIWNKLRDRGWRDPDEVLRRDSVGTSRPYAAQLMRNARAWSLRSPLTERLAPWFDAVDEHLDAWPDGAPG